MSESKLAGDVIKIPLSPYKGSGSSGSWGIINNNNVAWMTCRDQFQTSSEPAHVMSFVFCFPSTVNPDNIIEFIRTVEQIVNVPKDKQIVFSKTNYKDVLHIGMSDWWKYRVRRSLLTAFIRCGMYYLDHNGEGFTKAIRCMPYTASTYAAVERFLSGYTAVKVKKGTFSGWQQFFSSGSNVKALVKLKKKKPESPTPAAVVAEAEAAAALPATTPAAVVGFEDLKSDGTVPEVKKTAVKKKAKAKAKKVK